MNLNNGDIIVVKNSNKGCGYKRGDTLQVERLATTVQGSYICNNLTRPDHYGGSWAFISKDYTRYKVTYPLDTDIVIQVRVFGIKIFEITKDEGMSK